MLFGSMSGSNPRFIFTKADIEDPVYGIFNLSMLPNGVGEPDPILFQTRNKKSAFEGGFTLDGSLGFDQADQAWIGPRRRRLKFGQVIADPVTTDFETAVILWDGFMILERGTLKILRFRSAEKLLNFLKQVAVIRFQG